MAASDVKLLGMWCCPYVNRAQLAMCIKSIDYEFIEENTLQKSEMLLKYNPVHKKIPVLIHGDKSVCESCIIVEYIGDAFAAGPSILPSDAYDRALARFWAAYIDDKWYPLVKVIRQSDDKEGRAALIEKLSEGLILLEEAFISCSKGKAYFGGDSIGYLDIILGSCLGWLRVTEKVVEVELLDRTKAPELVRWAERLCSDDKVKAIFPDTQRLMELHEKIVAYLKSAK
ncbi:Glutathione S-transferase family protein [Perilla frutescens var. hirtella]|uniref:glutathione transferase n=1 Tax=Perilla frutescens var. hirtella TaxID=608512 RepID=A0AAD4IPI2_PERFH|nr:Glutathione S-transferase family protein [Perilla frutescens var. hirtella]